VNKAIALLAIICLLLITGAAAAQHHDHAVGCDPGQINARVDQALSAYFGARGAQANEAAALDALRADLDSIATACATAPASPPAAQSAVLTGDEAAFAAYAAIPQSRLADGAFILGDPDAALTVIVFADFACPHCQNYAAIVKRFIDEYVVAGRARLEYRMFISGADPVYGPYVAQLAECAEEQRPGGGFWVAHDVLYELGSRARFSQATALTLAERLALDYDSLRDCAATASQYRTDVTFGSQQGVTATPTIMIRVNNSDPGFLSTSDGVLDRGPVPYEVLQAVVAAFD
jgi:protein-disulfide isomerase